MSTIPGQRGRNKGGGGGGGEGAQINIGSDKHRLRCGWDIEVRGVSRKFLPD